MGQDYDYKSKSCWSSHLSLFVIIGQLHRPFIVKYSRHCLETLFQIEYGITYEEIEDLQKIYSLLNAQGSAHVLHTISNYLITGYVTL